MKKVLATLLTMFLLATMIPLGAVSVSAATVNRDDGIWLFPLPQTYYNNFSDWAGCPGNDKCVFCGVYHNGWGDSAHTGQGGHNGIDVAAPSGTSVYASAEGITYAFSNSARGNTVVIEHQIGNGYSYYTYYQHLLSYSVSNGQRVKAGDVIGKVGSTGDSGGNHLHFGMVMGTSGQTGNSSLLNTLEGKGWITGSGYTSGRILNNPASTNDAGFPTGKSAVVPPLKAHYGSIHYTFDPTKVTIGNIGEATPIYEYDPDAAIAYAKKHWNDGYGECARFVSNCIRAGGFIGAHSPSVTELVNQLKDYGTIITCSGWSAGKALTASMFNGTLSKGDIIIWKGPNSGHALLYSKTNSKDQILVYAHNSAKNEEICAPESQFTEVYAIHLPSTPPIVYTAIASGSYRIKNIGTERYLCVSEGKDHNGQNIGAGIYDGSVAQAFEVTPSANTAGYVMRPLCSTARVLNVHADDVINGSDVSLYDNTAGTHNEDSQRWNFEAVDGGYVIRNVQSPSCVLTVQSNHEVRVQAYTGADSQIWTLELEGCSHTYDNDCDTTCNTCGEVRTVEDHPYTTTITTAATCGTAGVMTYTCSTCGDSYTETIPATGKHTYDDEYDADCNVCGAIREVPEKPPATPDLPADAPAFVVESATARAGEEFTIAIRTERNSGIVSFKLKVAYDADLLELVSVTEKDFAGMSFSPLTNNPFIINWVDALHPNNTTNGVMALVTFRVKEGAAAGKTEINLSYVAEDVYDQNFDNVAFLVENGAVQIVDYTPGDVNDDGAVNNKDLGLLQRLLNEWDVTANKKAADANGDGAVNNKDLGILQRYLNEWDVTLG